MKKTIYLIRGEKAESYNDFKNRILSLVHNLVKNMDSV